MTRVLSAPADNGAVPVTVLFSTTYYDKFGHVLRSIAENHLKGRDVISNIYESITYLVQSTRQQHFKGGQVTTLEKTFEYDHVGRLLSTREKVNAQAEVTMNAMKYNELGQLIIKYLHSGTTSGNRSFVQKVDYNYNIRGWLNKINDPSLTAENDLFGLLLCYESTAPLGSLDNSTRYYNGNIVGMKWGIKNDPAVARGYRFTYDELNRLKTTSYADGASLNADTSYFTESVTSYDKNGNIKGLKRKYNNVMVDNLTYSYLTNSNQIQSISDAGLNNDVESSKVNDYPGNSSTYEYDANGNMIQDGSRNASLTYHNAINLPSMVNFGSDNRIFYHYTPTGTKLLKHTDAAEPGTDTYTHYIGNVVYENGKLSYILTEEGRLVNVGTNANPLFVYEYNLKDHLGNNRVTFMGSNLGGAVDVVQTSHYYPFGLLFSQTNNSTSADYSKNKYLYNGKELQDDNLNGTFFGLLDYGARFYDPQIGRWHSVDPLCEVNRRWSPYRYAYDNPLRFLDPDGMLEEVYIKGNQANAATQQLDASSSLSISRDSKTGKISATGTAVTKNDQKLLEAINSKDVTVNITADNSKTLPGNKLLVGGAFGGNTLQTKTETTTVNMGFEDAVGENTMEISTTTTTVSTTQNVNPTVLGALDKANGNNGQAMLHETLESYEGGKISLSKGTSSPAADIKGSVWQRAHNRAPSQGGVVTAEYWDAAGNALPDAPGAVKARISSNNKVIMTWP
jgi:RHS repeat-associated protein